MRRRPPLALLGLFTLVGFLLVVTGTATSVASETEAPRRQALIDQILDQRQNVDDLDKAVAEVRDQVGEARRSEGAVNNESEERRRQEEQFSLQAGTTALKGRGLVVELGDAPRRPEDDKFKFDSSRIQDSDIQLVVNALFATGAEAVAINDNRVAAVTPIRAAGGTIVVNYRPVESPYRIAAIGVDVDRFESTDIVSHFKQWEQKFNLSFSIKKSKDVQVPAYAGRIVGGSAKPAETGASSSAQGATSTTQNSGGR